MKNKVLPKFRTGIQHGFWVTAEKRQHLEPLVREAERLKYVFLAMEIHFQITQLIVFQSTKE